MEHVAVGQFERRVFAKQALSNARRASRKIARRPKARSAGGDIGLMSPRSTRNGHRAQQAGKTRSGLSSRALAWGPPSPCRVAGRRAVFPSGACAASFERCPSRALIGLIQRPGAVSAAGRQRLVLAGPHPRSRCSSTSLVAAAAGATGPASDFSGRCDRDCGANALRSN